MARPKTTRDTYRRFGRLLQHLMPVIRQEKSLIAGSVTAMIVSVGFGLLEPWPLKFVLDLIIPAKLAQSSGLLAEFTPNTVLTLACIGLVAIVGLRATSDYFKTVGFALVGNRVMSRVRTNLYRHIQALSPSFHDKARSGDLLIRVTGDIKLMRDVAITAILPLMASVLVLFGMVAVMFWLNWQLTLLALLVMPLFAVSSIRIGRRIHSAARKQREREGDMAASAAEALSSVRIVQALSLESHFENHFCSENKRSVKEGVKTRRLAARLERTADVLIACAYAIVMWYGSRLVLRSELSPGSLVVFLTYLKRGFQPFQDFAKYTGRLAKAVAAGERIVDLLDETSEIQDAMDAVEAPKIRGDVRFTDVSFGYSPDAMIFRDISFSIPSGHRVALVGDSGAGKSTVLHLLLRFYNPESGVITIDDCDIRQWKVASLRRQVGVVLQDTILFAGDVSENIALGALNVTQQQIEEAARIANAHDFITNLPQGYNTVLGERGINLSQGQRQRIAIARAAVRDSRILLLDEPTSALDEQNEREVSLAISRLAQGRTTFLVTHDLRQAETADLIMYFERGRIKEVGTHEDLLDLNGRYALLYNSQVHGFVVTAHAEIHAAVS
jgi:ATP-binding cassette subfamily B protein